MTVPVLRWIGPPQGPAIELLDQTRLPAEEAVVSCADVPSLVDAIGRLVVRGAPALGQAGAYGVALAAYRGDDVAAAAQSIGAARPTAVNLGWGARRALAAYTAAAREAGRTGTASAAQGRTPAAGAAAGRTPAAGAAEGRTPAAGAAQGRTGTAGRAVAGPAAAALAEARRIAAAEAAASAAMAAHGLALLPPHARVLTHCNTGELAAPGGGTAFAVIHAAHRTGQLARLWIDETRPLLQGARLTAWEASRAGMDFVVLPDSAAASLLASGQVDAVLTGADRIAADGSVANKIGTYGLAVLARHHQVPFVVVAPMSTIDFGTADGSGIVVEHRAASEVLTLAGQAIAPAGSAAYNPAFDVTPSSLISAIVTERGIAQPVSAGTLRVLNDRPAPDMAVDMGAVGEVSMEL